LLEDTLTTLLRAAAELSSRNLLSSDNGVVDVVHDFLSNSSDKSFLLGSLIVSHGLDHSEIRLELTVLILFLGLTCQSQLENWFSCKVPGLWIRHLLTIIVIGF